MVVLLSLLTAVCYGTGDFCGGLAAKRASIIQVVAGSHVVGLFGVVVASFLLADEFRMDDFLLGAIGGAFGGLGVGLLYRRLAIGPMQVVAPLTALTSAALPTFWGVLTGETLNSLSWVGVGLGLLAVGLVSASPELVRAPVTPQVVAESLLAGVGFGGFFIFLDATDAASSPWPVTGARVLTVTLLIGYLVARRKPVLASTTIAIGFIAAAGALDTLSNVLFLYATNRGLLTIVAVLTALYPIATVLLARVVLGERMNRPQLAGFVAAMAATVIIAGA